jgi:ALG11 mannosyltransferase N-terminus
MNTMLLLLLLWNSTKLVVSFMLIICILFIIWHRVSSLLHRRLRHHTNDTMYTNRNGKVIAFFHPYCTGGGGGERVLWKMIQVLGNIIDDGENKKSVVYNHNIIIYTIDPPSSSYIQCKLQQ